MQFHPSNHCQKRVSRSSDFSLDPTDSSSNWSSSNTSSSSSTSTFEVQNVKSLSDQKYKKLGASVLRKTKESLEFGKRADEFRMLGDEAGKRATYSKQQADDAGKQAEIFKQNADRAGKQAKNYGQRAQDAGLAASKADERAKIFGQKASDAEIQISETNARIGKLEDEQRKLKAQLDALMFGGQQVLKPRTRDEEPKQTPKSAAFIQARSPNKQNPVKSHILMGNKESISVSSPKVKRDTSPTLKN